MKFLIPLLLLIFPAVMQGQNLFKNITVAVSKLEADEQFKHAVLSMYIVETMSGKTVYEKNAQTGMAPASCQKVITSVTAFELLGKDYQYKTQIAYEGNIRNNTLNGNLYFIGYGDPTLGSWRWKQTEEETIRQKIIDVLRSKNISAINGDIIIDDSKWESQATANGWIWEDIGNYYGAGARAVNWHENQYDLILKPGKKAGDDVEIIRTEPELQITVLVNELKTGKEGSGDNSIIYLPENGLIGYVRGTVPAGKEKFTVGGAIPNAPQQFGKTIEEIMAANKITVSGKIKTTADFFANKKLLNYSPVIMQTLLSPTFDSINYWFLKKSINLYGEALVKTMAYEKTAYGSADTGLAIIKDFWSKRGIEKDALKIIDGSGLSPANRVTTNALVRVMQYARRQSWFSTFYNALPEMNGIKMKDGYISGVRSYTGYIKSKTGMEYTFSFIVNNFDGNPATVREKMWKVLDLLK